MEATTGKTSMSRKFEQNENSFEGWEGSIETNSPENISSSEEMDNDHVLFGDWYFGELRQPEEEEAFNGSTVEEIAAAIPHDYGLVVEIVNNLDSNLTDLELYLHAGLQQRKAPHNVLSNTTTIFSIRPRSFILPHGVMLYKIGDSGFSLHLYFSTSKARVAVGFLENSASVKAIWPVHEKCSDYNHTGTDESFICIDDYDAWSPENIFTIQQDTIYAKLTGYTLNDTFISRVEINKF